jgi:hypothetical protein
MLVKLIDHQEHGLIHLRDDYYARRRAIVGGIVLASALLLGQIIAVRIDNALVGTLVQVIISAVGFSYGLICAAWPNDPRQTAIGIAGGTSAFCLLALAGGLLLAAIVFLIAFVPAAVGDIPSVGGALLGVLAVLLGGLAGSVMVVGSAVVLCLAGFITLRVAAGAELDDALLNEVIEAAGDKKRFLPALGCLIGAGLLAISGIAVLNMGTGQLLSLNSNSSGMTELAVGLRYLVDYRDIGIVLASTGSAQVMDLLAGILTVVATAFMLGLLLALPLAIAARSLLIYMGIGGADFSVAHAASIAHSGEEEEPPPVTEDPESLSNLDLREAIKRPESWHAEGGRATKRELLQVKRRDQEAELESRDAIPGFDD